MNLSTIRHCYGCQREGADSVIDWKERNERVILAEFSEDRMDWTRVKTLSDCISQEVKKCLECVKTGEAY